MKKYLLFFLPILAFSFSLSVNSGAEDGKTYSVLNLLDEKEFACKEEILAYDRKLYYCDIPGGALPKVSDKILSLVEVRFREEKGGMRIYVVPRANSRLISSSDLLYGESVVPFSKNGGLAKRHTIVIDQNLSEFKKQTNAGVNFAPIFERMISPSVGPLDLNKAPIENSDSNDINMYLDVKKSYDAKHYDDAIATSQTALRRYANSIFASEFLLYRLRALDKILDSQNSFEGPDAADIASEGRAWMRRFVSDENYPEVLYLVTKAYLKQELVSDANYTLDILINEHPNSNFTKLAILEFADRLYVTGRQDEAVRMYENVLYSAQTLDVASRAALSLVQGSIDKAKFDRAKEYMLKILDRNHEYLLNDTSKLTALAGIFHEKKIDDIAARIYEILLARLNKNDDDYETVLKNLGIALTGTPNTQKAYDYLKRYQSEFADGQYAAVVQNALDRLFFARNDESNATKLHERYDALIEKYGKTDVGAKALKEQVALYLKERKFEDVLRYTQAVRDLNDTDASAVLAQAALNLTNEAIRQNDCATAVNLTENYGVGDKIGAKFKLFDCYMRLSRFAAAHELASQNILAPDMLDRVEWLIKLASVLIKTQKYNDALRVADEALAVASRQEYADVSPVLFYRFEALMGLGRFADAAATITAVETLRKNDFKVIELYDRMAEATYGANDFLNASVYAKKAIDLQKRLHIDTFSPKIDFEYIGSLSKLDKLGEALQAAHELVDTRLDPENRLRALAQISEIYIKLKRESEAKPYLQECVGSNLQSSWKAICAEQMKLVE